VLNGNETARRLLAASPPTAPSSIWSTSEDPAAPRVILGRTTLINWIAEAEVETPAVRGARIYAAAATTSGPEGSKGFGKSFSIEILRAARRHAGEHYVVLGTPEALLPATAPDVLGAIAAQLGIPSMELATMPARPSMEAVAGIGGNDKLSLLASVELPAWFDVVLARRRQVVRDLAAEAREDIALLDQRGEPIPEPLRKQEQSGETIVVSRWKHVWIALDGLDAPSQPGAQGGANAGHLAEEIRNLLAGLTGSNGPEASVRPELRRLRWLFLGFVPDFVGNDATVELLDPLALTADDCAAPIKRMAAALGRVLGDGYVTGLRDLLEEMLGRPPYNDPHQRLGSVQSLLASLLPKIEGSVRKTPTVRSAP